MAWDPNEKGNPAWLTKEASKHGGPEPYIQDIHDEGYQEGYDEGKNDGIKEAAAIIGAGIGLYALLKHKWNSRKRKKQELEMKAEYAKEQIRQNYQEPAYYGTDTTREEDINNGEI